MIWSLRCPASFPGLRQMLLPYVRRRLICGIKTGLLCPSGAVPRPHTAFQFELCRIMICRHGPSQRLQRPDRQAHIPFAPPDELYMAGIPDPMLPAPHRSGAAGARAEEADAPGRPSSSSSPGRWRSGRTAPAYLECSRFARENYETIAQVDEDSRQRTHEMRRHMQTVCSLLKARETENAVEACMCMKDPAGAYIELAIRKSQRFLFIECENSVDPGGALGAGPDNAQGRPKGARLRSGAVAEKYASITQIQREPGRFVVRTNLCLPE